MHQGSKSTSMPHCTCLSMPPGQGTITHMIDSAYIQYPPLGVCDESAAAAGAVLQKQVKLLLQELYGTARAVLQERGNLLLQGLWCSSGMSCCCRCCTAGAKQAAAAGAVLYCRSGATCSCRGCGAVAERTAAAGAVLQERGKLLLQGLWCSSCTNCCCSAAGAVLQTRGKLLQLTSFF